VNKVSISYGLVVLMILLGTIIGNLITNKASHLTANLNREYFDSIETEIEKDNKQQYLNDSTIDKLKHYLIKNEFITKTYKADYGWVTVAKKMTLKPRIELKIEIYHHSFNKGISNIAVTIDGSRYNFTDESILVVNETANLLFSEIAQITSNNSCTEVSCTEAIKWINDNIVKSTDDKPIIEHSFGNAIFRLNGSEFKRFFEINPSI